jgi:hypothetical protein
MSGSHLECTLWAQLTIIFNSMYNYCESVELGEVALGDLDFLFLALVRVLGFLGGSILSFALFLVLGRLFGRLLSIAFLCIQKLVRLAEEIAGGRVNEAVLFDGGEAEAWHLFELEVRRSGQRPVESFLGELVHAAERNGDREVVVSTDARDLAPEKHLVCLNGGSQLAQAHFQLHSKK